MKTLATPVFSLRIRRAAGENPEHVFEISETNAIVSTMALSIGRLVGEDQDDLVQVLRAKGAQGVDVAASATSAVVPYAGSRVVSVKASGVLVTSDGGGAGRRKRN